MGHDGEAVHRSVVAVDVEGFGARTRTDADRLKLRQGMHRSLREAFGTAGVDLSSCHVDDSGDGLLILVPPDAPKVTLVDLLPRALADALARHNEATEPGAAMRMRMAVHAGEVTFDESGVTGSAIVHAFRMLDAPRVRAVLAESDGSVVLVVSAWIQDEVIRHLEPRISARFTANEATLKETTAPVWVRLFPSEASDSVYRRMPQRPAGSWRRHTYVNHDKLFGAQHNVDAVGAAITNERGDDDVSGVGDSSLDELQRSFGNHLTELYRASKITSHGELATRSEVPKTTVSDWLAGRFAHAPDWDKLQAIVKACVAHAPDDPEVRRLGDLDWWRRDHDRLVHDLQRLPPKPRRERARPEDPRVGQWSADGLGVHRAVTVDGDGTGRAELTGYLPRMHDDRLRRALREGVRIVVLTGSTCTGKTRAAYEAVRAEFAALPLLRPFGPDELLRRAAAGDLRRPGVLWLNELHTYLDHPAGQQVVDALATAVGRPGGVVVVSTTQTAMWDALTDEESPREAAREFLVGVQQFEVPESFADDEDTRAQLADAGVLDARFAYAVQAAPDGRVIQALTGGPALLAMLGQPRHALARALVKAAIDWALLSRDPAVPTAFLQAAAPGYLTEAERVGTGTWFDDAVAAATKPIRGVSALTPLRLAREPGMPDAFRPHDFLVNHWTVAREPAPATSWSALVEHVADLDARLALAASAKAAFLLRIAAHALLPVVREPAAVEAMIWLLDNKDEEWLRFAAEQGSADGIWYLALAATERGDRAEAAHWWRRHLELTHGFAMSDQIGALEEVGLLGEAVEWLRTAADAGKRNALFATYDLLCRADRHAEAVDRLTELADAGDRDAQVRVAWAYDAMGNRDEAVRRMTAIAEAGDSYAMSWLVDTGDNVEFWTRRAVEQGSKWAIKLMDTGEDPLVSAELWRHRNLLRASGLYEAGGDLSKAMELWRPGVDAGDALSMRMFGELLAKSGDRAAAEALLRKSAEDGLAVHRYALVDFLIEGDRHAEAAYLVKDDAERGDMHAVDSYVKILTAASQRSEAITWLEGHAERGSVRCMRLLGKLFDSAVWRERAARAEGGGDLARTFAREHWQAGRTAEAERILRPTASHDGRSARLLVEILEERGELVKAEDLLRGGLERGTVGMHALSWFLEKHGRVAEADRLKRYGIEPGGRTAEPWRLSPPPT
ncbi:hypothetical protein OG439_20285 [Amycolatopsis sp. NBC_01307]|uniref:hypothetical protein n=1 Tax=Amycolatopsis sp. NBC_01307 TaxID=2903561 RepID=UPI002E153E48|nr:hypothetical protein OG439_20285 [Amycolatopsis sp. NBC_01307]